MTARWEMDLSPGTLISPFKWDALLNSIICYLPFLSGLHAEHLVFVFIQPLPRSLHGCLVIEGDFKRPLTPLAVVVDADILNADALGSQDDGYGGRAPTSSLTSTVNS